MATKLNSLSLSLDGAPLIRVSPRCSHERVSFYIGDDDKYTNHDIGFITSERYRERLLRAAAEFNRIMRDPIEQEEE